MIENSQTFGVITATNLGQIWDLDISLINFGKVPFGILALPACFCANSVSLTDSLAFYCSTYLKYTAHAFACSTQVFVRVMNLVTTLIKIC